MKITSLLILGLLSFSVYADADITDILFNREASIEEKQAVADELEKEKDKPLDAMESVAEICYEIDLCAGASTEDDLKTSCSYYDLNDPEKIPNLGSECYAKLFRSKHSCNKDIDKQSMKTAGKLSTMLEDYSQVYNTYIMNPVLKFLSKKMDVNLCEMKNDSAEMKDFIEKNPDFLKKILAFSKNATALGQYTQNCYQKINPILFANDKAKLKRYFNLFTAISSSMEYFPEHKGKVNRGTRLPNEALLEHHKIGNIVCYKGFTSTAIHDKKDYGDKPRNSFLDDKCAQRLYINFENNGATPGKLIDEGSVAQGENEVLFEPGACFRIDKVTPRTDPVKEEDKDQVCGENQRFNFEMTLVPSQK